MKKPTIEKFTEVLTSTGGNISQTAKILRVNRSVIYDWIKNDHRFESAVNDCRGKLLDECIAVSRIVALGIPEKDADGKMIGWIERPDSSMLRYLLSTLGRNEGFGERVEVKAETEIKGSIPIKAWVEENIIKKKKFK